MATVHRGLRGLAWARSGLNRRLAGAWHGSTGEAHPGRRGGRQARRETSTSCGQLLGVHSWACRICQSGPVSGQSGTVTVTSLFLTTDGTDSSLGWAAAGTRGWPDPTRLRAAPSSQAASSTSAQHYVVSGRVACIIVAAPSTKKRLIRDASRLEGDAPGWGRASTPEARSRTAARGLSLSLSDGWAKHTRPAGFEGASSIIRDLVCPRSFADQRLSGE